MGAAMMTVDHIIFSYRAIVHHQHYHRSFRRRYVIVVAVTNQLLSKRDARRIRTGVPLLYHRNRGPYSSVATVVVDESRRQR